MNGENPGQFEVINASVSAWGTDQQLVYYLKEGSKYQPDHVILMMAPNDIRESYCKKWINMSSAGVAWKTDGFDRKTKFRWKLATNFRLYRYLEERTGNPKQGDIFSIFETYPVNFNKEDDEHWDLPLFLKESFPEVQEAKFQFSYSLKLLNEFIQENGGQLSVAVIPTEMEFDGTLADSIYQSGLIAEQVSVICGSFDIEYIYLYEKSLLLNDVRSLYLVDDFHFNEAGHEFVARELMHYIKPQ